MFRRRGGAVRLGGLTRNMRRPDTRANVELSVVFGVLSLRAFDLLQGTFALTTGSLTASTNPRLELTVFMVLVVDSILLGAWLAKRRSLQPCAWPILADFGLALATVGLVPAYISRSAVWTMWPWPVPVDAVHGRSARRELCALAIHPCQFLRAGTDLCRGDGAPSQRR